MLGYRISHYKGRFWWNSALYQHFEKLASSKGCMVTPIVYFIFYFLLYQTLIYQHKISRLLNILFSVSYILNQFQILIENQRATGVEFIRKVTKSQVLARKEVILSAGTIGSAHILLLSGIGPKQHLMDMGVKNWIYFYILKGMIEMS